MLFIERKDPKVIVCIIDKFEYIAQKKGGEHRRRAVRRTPLELVIKLFTYTDMSYLYSRSAVNYFPLHSQ